MHIAISEAKEQGDAAQALASSTTSMFNHILQASNLVPHKMRFHAPQPCEAPSIIDELLGELSLSPAQQRLPFPFPPSRGKTPKSRGRTPKLETRGSSAASGVDQQVSPLHLAALSGDADDVGALLAAGAAPNAGDVDGLTPLHYAAGDNHAAALVRLLDGGADVMLGDKEGDLALHIAVQEGQWEVVASLLNRMPELVDARGAWGNTALHYAAGSGQDLSDIVELLLAKGADISSKNEDGDTPLALARRVMTIIGDHPHFKVISGYMNTQEGREVGND